MLARVGKIHILIAVLVSALPLMPEAQAWIDVAPQGPPMSRAEKMVRSNCHESVPVSVAILPAFPADVPSSVGSLSPCPLEDLSVVVTDRDVAHGTLIAKANRIRAP